MELFLLRHCHYCIRTVYILFTLIIMPLCALRLELRKLATPYFLLFCFMQICIYFEEMAQGKILFMA